jgi:hypothetical protein
VPGRLSALQKLPGEAATAPVEFIYGSLADNQHRLGKPLRHELPTCTAAAVAATASTLASR